MAQCDMEDDVAVMDKQKQGLKEPPMYRCILLNDNFTPMDFVVMVLTQVFGKNNDDARSIMMKVHKNGKGVCGVYTYEVAETKIKQVEMFAEKYSFPLKCTMEEDK